MDRLRNRRRWMGRCAALGLAWGLPTLPGCRPAGPRSGRFERVWGRRGWSDGRFLKPRAVAIDDQDLLYIVDTTGRIQVFDRDGEFQRSWRTPEIKHGKPCGLGIDHQGRVLVADTHYFRMLVYSPTGQLFPELTIGGTHGSGPGEFGFLTDATQDSRGCYYIGEYGEFDRIQKFSPEGEFLTQWGRHGSESGEFLRPQGLEIDDQDWLWVADAGNHRIQVFDVSSEPVRLVRSFGRQGTELGRLSYPYGVALDPEGFVYVCEFGNHRVQKLTLDGEPIGAFGSSGRRDGEFHQPWGLVQDSTGRLHVLDSYNHRVQRCTL